MLAEFFVLLQDGDTRRLPLRQDIQARLSEQFEEAASRLLSPNVELIPLSNALYTPDYGQEAWRISPFVVPSQIADALRDSRTLPDLARSEVADLQVRAIGARFQEGRHQPWIALQAIDRRQVIKSDGLSIILDRGVFRQLEEPGLQLGGNVHAVIVADSLIFDQIHWVKRILDIGDYYREATDADVAAFARNPNIAFEDQDAFLDQADEWVRKRVALITDCDVFARCGPRQIRDKAAEYGITVQISRQDRREKVLVPATKREMKELLKFLGEDIYKGPLTEILYVSTSKRRR